MASADGSAGHAGGSAIVAACSALEHAVRGSTSKVNFANARGGAGPANANQAGGFTLGGGLLADPRTGRRAFRPPRCVTTSPTGPPAPPPPGGPRPAAGGIWITTTTIGGIAETNVTYIGNIARATGGQTLGGGLALVGQGLGQSLTNVTISGNIATAGTANQGGSSSSARARRLPSKTRSSMRARRTRALRTARCTGRCPPAVTTSTAAISATSTPPAISHAATRCLARSRITVVPSRRPR